MFLNNIGPWEWLIIAGVGLVTIGVPVATVIAVVLLAKRRPRGPKG